MAIFNSTSREVILKLVYYGPALSGKTTNLEKIYQQIPEDKKGKMLTISTEADRTLFFDFLPLELGRIQGWSIRIQLYTVPGQVFYDATRQVVLKGADAVVFVADSQNSMREANLESLDNMKKNLAANNLDYATIPLVFQYNKRDLKNIDSVEDLNRLLNERNVPYFEAIAIEGVGVMETLKAITRLALEAITTRLKRGVAVAGSPTQPLSEPQPSPAAPSSTTPITPPADALRPRPPQEKEMAFHEVSAEGDADLTLPQVDALEELDLSAAPAPSAAAEPEAEHTFEGLEEVDEDLTRQIPVQPVKSQESSQAKPAPSEISEQFDEISGSFEVDLAEATGPVVLESMDEDGALTREIEDVVDTEVSSELPPISMDEAASLSMKEAAVPASRAKKPSPVSSPSMNVQALPAQVEVVRTEEGFEIHIQIVVKLITN